MTAKVKEDEEKVENLLSELDAVRRRLLRNRQLRDAKNRKEREKLECVVREIAESGQLPLAQEETSFRDLGVDSPFD